MHWEWIIILPLIAQLPVEPRNVTKFSVIRQPLTWNDAYQVCEKRGGHLAQLVDQPTNNAVTENIRNFYNITGGLNIGLAWYNVDIKWVPGCHDITWENWMASIDQENDTHVCGKFDVSELSWRRAACQAERSSICQYDTDEQCPYNMHGAMAVPLNGELTLITWVYPTPFEICKESCSENNNCWAFELYGLFSLCSLYTTSTPERIEEHLYVNVAGVVFIKNCFILTEGEPWNLTTTPNYSKLPIVDCSLKSVTTTATNENTTNTYASKSITIFDTSQSITSATINSAADQSISTMDTTIDKGTLFSSVKLDRTTVFDSLATLFLNVATEKQQTFLPPTTDFSLQEHSDTDLLTSSTDSSFIYSAVQDSLIQPETTAVTYSSSQPEATSALDSSSLKGDFVEPTSGGLADHTYHQLLDTAPTHTSTALKSTQKDKSSELKKCLCCSVKSKLPKKQKADVFLSQLLADLSIRKSSLSSQRRRYRSVSDNSPFATVVGYTGVIVLVSIFCLIVLSDIFVLKKKG